MSQRPALPAGKSQINLTHFPSEITKRALGFRGQGFLLQKIQLARGGIRRNPPVPLLPVLGVVPILQRLEAVGW